MPEKSTPSKIYISRTKREWNAIEKKLEELGRKDFSSYVRGSLLLLKKQYKDSPSSVCTAVEKRIQRPQRIPEEYFEMLDVISLRTGLPVSTIVDRLIIDPLLMPNLK